MSIILKAENISKQYRLGLVGSTTIKDDARRIWASIRGKEDPFLKVGVVNDRSTKADQDYIWALKEINFEVKQGEVLGIIGKNGAGKSTLLKILSRVTSPTTGSIKTRGRIASLLEIGTGFHPELTGRENIFMNGAVLGMTRSEIRSKLDEIIAFSGCEKYIDTPVKRYSSGMTVRLGFAVAAHLEPEILVVDEVLAVGDAEFQKKAIGKMQDLSTGEGRTVLFVSHNMGSIQKLCTDLLVLENGKILFEGQVENGINKYLEKTKIEVDRELSERGDRKGGENFRFTDIVLKNCNEEEVASVLSGQKYSFKIDYKNKTDLDDLEVRLAFYDDVGTLRFLCNNKFSNRTFNIIDEKNGSITCVIPNFPLPKGIYFLQLTCYGQNFIYDEVNGALSFEVVGGDFYNTGKEQFNSKGVLVPYQFYF